MILRFDVQNQTLSRTESARTVEGTQNYLQCAFSFSEDWNGLSKAVLFKSIDMEKPIAVLLGADNVCNIPNGATAQHLSIALIGGGTDLMPRLTSGASTNDITIITTNTLSIPFETTLDSDCIAELDNPRNDFAKFLAEINSFGEDLKEQIFVLSDIKVDKEPGKTLSENDFTTELKDKLNASASTAYVDSCINEVNTVMMSKASQEELASYFDELKKNTVSSVSGKTGNVVLDKSDVGLGNVDNTADRDKPLSQAMEEALSKKTEKTELEQAVSDLNSEINSLEEKHDSDIAKIKTSLKATSAELANTELNLKHDVDQKLEETKTKISNDIDLAVAQSASSLRSEITGATKDKVDKATISLTSTDTVKLYSNTETRLVSDDVSSLVLTVPAFFDLYYQCYLSFKSGDTPTTLTYSDTPIKWVGVDCDSDGDFVPTANKIYEVAIKNVGGGFDASSGETKGEPIIVARVGAVDVEI